jgi:uncharacterized protein with HEPN domain
MLQAARALVRFVGGVSLPEFLADGSDLLRAAVERKLEIIGEAARRLSPAFRERHPGIPWKETSALRNLISHEYDRVNYQEIYRIVRARVPELISQLAPLATPPPDEE